MYDHLQAQALNPDHTRRFITRAAQELLAGSLPYRPCSPHRPQVNPVGGPIHRGNDPAGDLRLSSVVPP
ncbi:hypothetical protein ACWDYJ_13100 [Streptomyces sp. NPDC003042]